MSTFEGDHFVPSLGAMRFAFVASLLAVGAGCSSGSDGGACTPKADAPIACGMSGTFDRKVCIDGNERLYREYVPAGIACDKPAPLVVFLHGLGGDESSGDAADPVADAVGAVFVTPRGADQGAGLGFGPEQIPNTQRQITTILDTLEREFPTDPAFTLMTGFSNGGVFASYSIAWFNARLAGV